MQVVRRIEMNGTHRRSSLRKMVSAGRCVWLPCLKRLLPDARQSRPMVSICSPASTCASSRPCEECGDGAASTALASAYAAPQRRPSTTCVDAGVRKKPRLMPMASCFGRSGVQHTSWNRLARAVKAKSRRHDLMHGAASNPSGPRVGTVRDDDDRAAGCFRDAGPWTQPKRQCRIKWCKARRCRHPGAGSHAPYATSGARSAAARAQAARASSSNSSASFFITVPPSSSASTMVTARR